MKSKVVEESLSSFKPMYCSREYQASTRLIQQYEKSTLKPDKMCKMFRKLRQINHQELRDDIIHEPLLDTTQLAELVQNYNSTLRQLLDKHAPVKSKIAKKNREQPWFNEQIKSDIILRQKKERNGKVITLNTVSEPSIIKGDFW